MIAALLLAASVVVSPSPALAQGEAERIDAVVQQHMRGPGAVGLSVAVARGETLLYSRGHGFAELEFAANANDETMFRIGSITKQFTAAAILKLAERGKLMIDDPLTKFLPDYPTHGHEITLRHLLTHTAGVPSYTDLGPVWERRKAEALSDAEMLALWQEKPLEFAPGERWKYSNSGYYLLGLVIEKVAGVPYGEFLREAFFDPLQLTRTRYDSNEELLLNRAQGYAFENERFSNDGLLDMRQPGAAGGLISSAGDLVKWQLALVGGRALSKASYEEMTLPFLLASGKETNYGMGLQLDTQAGQPCVWHGGGINGFNSVLLYFPGGQLSIAAISNGERLRADALGLALAKALLAAK